MFWRNIADATIEATLVSASFLGTVLVGLPFFLVLAAIITGLLGTQPPEDIQTIAAVVETPAPLRYP
ncbi:MAG: hypothetical protein AB7S71_01605 [Dongiaceae bacterium]